MGRLNGLECEWAAARLSAAKLRGWGMHCLLHRALVRRVGHMASARACALRVPGPGVARRENNGHTSGGQFGEIVVNDLKE